MILPLLKAARPVTLVASIAPVLIGTSISYSYIKSIDLKLFFLILACAVLLQAASNYLNDAIDFHKGSDTDKRLGPPRASQNGLVSIRTIYSAGIICLCLALLLGIPLVYEGGLSIFIIGISAIIFAYIYTGGPYPLAYNGFGELFAMLYYGVIAVTGTTYLYLNYLPTQAWQLGVQVGCFATALIAINNFRDIEEDRISHKRTLAVRFGLRFEKKVIQFFLVAPFVIELIFYTQNRSLYILPCLIIPIIIASKFSVIQPSKECNKYLGKVSLTELIFAITCVSTACFAV